MGDFSKDLKLGQKAEQYILAQLKAQYPNLEQKQGKFKGYDLSGDNSYTAEVKFDELSKKTKNVGIEYKCFGKPSGITTTQSYEWIHIYYFQGSWVYSRIKTVDLKGYIKSNWKYLQKVKGGDSNASHMVLIPSLDFAETFGYYPTSEGSKPLQ